MKPIQTRCAHRTVFTTPTPCPANVFKMDHGHMPNMEAHRCSMNMLWNTDIIDTCIVFRSWHISTKSAFVLSFFIIVGLGVLFEYLRSVQRAVDVKVALQLRWNAAKAMKSPGPSRPRSPVDGQDFEEAGLLSGLRVKTRQG